jgi:DNA-directed RNA polymerase subunit RPC12/RpoP
MWRRGFKEDKKMFNSQIKCPNCFKALSTKPKRKQACPHCGKFIFVRSGQLVREDESLITDWLASFEGFQVSRQNIYEAREKLREKLGDLPSVSETIGEILYDLLVKFGNDDIIFKSTKDAAFIQIYQALAGLAASEDKDPSQYLLEVEKFKKQHRKNLLAEVELDEDNEEEDEPHIPGKQIYLFQKELAYVRRLRKKGEFNKAEMMLMKAVPTPAVLDELRKLASTKARIAKRMGHWEAVLKHLEVYIAYADKWRHLPWNKGQSPRPHTPSDNKLLGEAKKRLGQ